MLSESHDRTGTANPNNQLRSRMMEQEPQPLSTKPTTDDSYINVLKGVGVGALSFVGGAMAAVPAAALGGLVTTGVGGYIVYSESQRAGELEKKLKEEQEANKKLKADLTVQTNKNASLTAALTQKNDIIKNARNQLAEKKIEIETLREQLRKEIQLKEAKEKEILSLEQQLEVKQHELACSEARIKKLEEDHEVAKDKISNLEETRFADQIKIENLEKKVQEAQAETALLSQDSRSDKDRISHLEKQLNKVEKMHYKEKCNLEIQLKSTIERSIIYEKAVEDLKEFVKDLKKETNDLKEKVNMNSSNFSLNHPRANCATNTVNNTASHTVGLEQTGDQEELPMQAEVKPLSNRVALFANRLPNINSNAPVNSEENEVNQAFRYST